MWWYGPAAPCRHCGFCFFGLQVLRYRITLDIYIGFSSIRPACHDRVSPGQRQRRCAIWRIWRCGADIVARERAAGSCEPGSWRLRHLTHPHPKRSWGIHWVLISISKRIPSLMGKLAMACILWRLRCSETIRSEIFRSRRAHRGIDGGVRANPQSGNLRLWCFALAGAPICIAGPGDVRTNLSCTGAWRWQGR